VAAANPFSGSEQRLLEPLLKRKVLFMVVGLPAAALQGAPVVTKDVDLWFENLGEKKMTDALRSAGAAYVPPSVLNRPMLKINTRPTMVRDRRRLRRFFFCAFCEGMSFVNGAPWNNRDAGAERTEAVVSNRFSVWHSSIPINNIEACCVLDRLPWRCRRG
jgi:hypothetical protein